MTKSELEKSLKFLRPHSKDLGAVCAYLRILGAYTYKRMLTSSGDELAALTGEFRIIQKLLDVIDASEDPCLVQTGQ